MDEEKLKPLSKKEQIDLSIIIVHYKTPSLLAQCVKSIKKSKPQLNYEIIVIDNNSMDETVEMMEDDFPDVNLIANKENIGFPKAVNQGIRKSKGEFILLLNPDITALENVLEGMIVYLKEHPEIGLLGPKLINPNGSVQKSCFSFYPSVMTVLYRRTFLGNFNRGHEKIKKFTMADWDHDSGREVAWVLGSAMLVPRKVIEKVGLMDERFFMYMEDVDWCRRIGSAGLKVYYYPDFKMVHYYARASDTKSNVFLAFFNRQTRIHIASAIKFFLKYARSNETKKS
ncbi:glycosyltransferase family 2 protein [Patescibacteria group bacterium]|nr:glycosyltransferase family 2 protein [Patescibacteria group bacterium]